MADSRRHPDVEILDGYADGYQPSPDVDRHVRGCADCQEMVESLRRVRRELAGLAKVTMPPDVATRIQAALEAENAATSAPGAGRTHTIPVTPGAFGRAGPGRRSRGRGRVRVRTLELLAAAAACLIAVIAVTGVFTTRGDRREAETSAAGGAASHAENYLQPSTAAGQDGSGDLPLAGEPAPGGGRSAPDTARQGAAGDSTRAAGGVAPEAPAAAGTAVTVAATDTSIAGDGLDRHANDLLAGRTGGEAARWQVDLDDLDGTEDPSAAPVLPPVADVPLSPQAWAVIQELTSPSLASCYRSLAEGERSAVLAVDRVRFGGRASVFVVLTVPNTSERVHVWIINMDCGQSGTTMTPRDNKIVQRS